MNNCNSYHTASINGFIVLRKTDMAGFLIRRVVLTQYKNANLVSLPPPTCVSVSVMFLKQKNISHVVGGAHGGSTSSSCVLFSWYKQQKENTTKNNEQQPTTWEVGGGISLIYHNSSLHRVHCVPKYTFPISRFINSIFYFTYMFLPFFCITLLSKQYVLAYHTLVLKKLVSIGLLPFSMDCLYDITASLSTIVNLRKYWGFLYLVQF